MNKKKLLKIKKIKTKYLRSHCRRRKIIVR